MLFFNLIDMKKILLLGLILSITHSGIAQRLEIKHYISNSNLFGKCIIIYNDTICTMQLDVYKDKDSLNIEWTEKISVPPKYLNDIKQIFEKATLLTSTKPYCLDGIIDKICVLYENDTSQQVFVCHCPFEGIEYYVFKETTYIMKKAFKHRRSRAYAIFIKTYLY